MYLFKKVNGFVAMAGLGLAFVGLIACSSDESSEREHDELPVRIESTVVIDENGNEVVKYDTIPSRLDSVKTIDPVTGDTFYKYDTVYVPADTTLR